MQQATIFDPSDSYYAFRLALLYVKGHYLDDAVAAMKRAIKLRPKERSYHLVLARVYRMCGKEEYAEAHERYGEKLDCYDLANLEVVKKESRVQL